MPGKQNIQTQRKGGDWRKTYPLICLSMALISALAAALTTVVVSKFFTAYSTFSRKTSASGSFSVSSPLNPVINVTRVWQTGTKRDRACLECGRWEKRDCGLVDALDVGRTERLETDRCGIGLLNGAFHGRSVTEHVICDQREYLRLQQ